MVYHNFRILINLCQLYVESDFCIERFLRNQGHEKRRKFYLVPKFTQ